MSKYDNWQTPAEAIDPLMPYLPRSLTIWEPAEGRGILTTRLREAGYDVFGTDKNAKDADRRRNFLDESGSLKIRHFDAIVTNPPYSLMDGFIRRCYQIGKPFALLLPVYALNSPRIEMFKQGLQILVLPKRINFIRDNDPQIFGQALRETSAPWATHWFTHGLNMPRDIEFA